MPIIRDQTFTFGGTNYRAGQPIPDEVARKYGLIDGPSQEEASKGEKDDPVEATPSAEELAEEHGIDLSEAIRSGALSGTGKGGRILKGDVAELVEG